MTFRDDERRKAWLEAQKEPLNTNGMRRDQPTTSTRITETAQRILAEPDPEPTLRPATLAGTSHVQYVGSVRERLELDQAKKREEKKKTPAQLKAEADAASWSDYNEAWRKKYGKYPER